MADFRRSSEPFRQRESYGHARRGNYRAYYKTRSYSLSEYIPRFFVFFRPQTMGHLYGEAHCDIGADAPEQP